MNYSKAIPGQLVRIKNSFFSRWSLSADNYAAHVYPSTGDVDVDYDEEIMIALYALLGGPVVGIIGEQGADKFIVWVEINVPGLGSMSQYMRTQDLEAI